MDAKLTVLFAFLLLVSGCGSIRVISEAKTGGTLALRGAHDAAREKAERYMREQCPDGFEVVEEGDTVGDTDDAREWRIAYRCNGSPSVAMIVF
ncbi:MAG: hypothetical protein KIT84_07545 [Labilithrix sp.]|nr:hypothetical protein [Labilithrix sp.]MCW5810849.1 hypothetical protein [Labilithrix sp.]